MNVLSFFDGISCLQLALNRAGIKYNNYYASEIKKIAIKVTQYHFPKTIQIGDITKVSYKDGILYTETGVYKVGIIDLMGGGVLVKILAWYELIKIKVTMGYAVRNLLCSMNIYGY